MNANRDFDGQIHTWLEENAISDPPIGLLDRSLGRVAATRQRSGWLVADRWSLPGAAGRAAPVPAGLMLVFVVAIAFSAVGAGLLATRLPSLFGAPSPLPVDSGSPSAEPSATPTPSSTASTDPSGPLGGGLILVHDPQIGEPGGSGLRVYAVDAGTGGKTLLGSLPPLLIDPDRSGYAMQWATDRAHVLITGRLIDRPIMLAEPTNAARNLVIICCVPSGGPDLSSWVLSPPGDLLAGLRTSQIDVPGMEGTLGVEDAIVIFDVQSSRLRTLELPVGTQVTASMSWSPDGSTVVVAGCRPCNNAEPGKTPTAIQHQRLFLVPVGGAPVRELLDETRATFGSPAWSPDGSTIAVGRAECPPASLPPYCSGGTTAIESIAVGQGERTTLAGVTEGVSGPVWAPDGSRIAFSDDGGVFVMNAEGAGPTRLAEGSLPRWSPDGRWVLYASPASAGDLWIVSADGGTPRHLGSYGGGAW